MASDRYNGMRRASDWKGRRVELVREIGNGYCSLPAGFKGTITQQGSTGLTFEGEPCGCCKVKPRVSRLGYHSVRLTLDAGKGEPGCDGNSGGMAGEGHAQPERAWLVEWQFNGVQWLYLLGASFNFTADANKAIRFARRADAEAALTWAQEFDRRRGMRPAGRMLVTEHEWPAGIMCAQDSQDRPNSAQEQGNSDGN